MKRILSSQKNMPMQNGSAYPQKSIAVPAHSFHMSIFFRQLLLSVLFT